MSKSRMFGLALLLAMSSFLVPLSAYADTRPARSDINVEWNGELTRRNGVRYGRGTPESPYVISGWTLNNLSIRDTDKAIRIVNNTITGTLRLNWIGPNVEVIGNTIGDLRVNENIARWGDPTAGHFMSNAIGVVGQLRHFDGHFMRNTVGAPQSGALQSSYPDTRAVNFDGFNGARFEQNTIYGYMDARLHGHHHASAFGGGSHMHATGPHDPRQVDHTRRFHETVISRNTIYSSAAYALAYLDTNHAANDRTANSETNPYLNAPHVHYTRATLFGNRLFGAGLLVDVFNAKDERHKTLKRGSLNIAGNSITLEQDPARPFRVVQGIEVRQARMLALRIASNSITGPAPLVTALPALAALTRLDSGAGVLLNTLDGATVTIENVRVTNRRFGVQAVQLSRSVTWSIKGLVTSGVDRAIAYDASVHNPPRVS